MSKGLPRSLANSPGLSNVVIKDIPFSVTVSMTATGAGIGWGTAVIGTLPAGALYVFGTNLSDLVITGDGSDVAATFNGDLLVGTSPINDATFNNAGIGLVAQTATTTAVANVATQAADILSNYSDFVDNSDGSLELNFNLLIDAANIADDSTPDVTVVGNLKIAYILFS